MRKLPSYFTLTALLFLSTSACFDSDEIDDIVETGRAYSVDRAPQQDQVAYDPGKLWGPCDENTWGEWGCDGSPGVQLACLRPLNGIPLSICALQVADTNVGPDCGNVYDPGFEEGVVLDSSLSYCIGTCKSDEDCPPDLMCSAYGICAWHE